MERPPRVETRGWVLKRLKGAARLGSPLQGALLFRPAVHGRATAGGLIR